MNISQPGGSGALSHGRPQRQAGVGRRNSAASAMDEFAAASWVQAYDAAWLGEDWDRLARYLAADVHFVPHGAKRVIAGREAVIEHLREFLKRAEVHEYNATDLRLRAARGVAYVSYRWQLDWTCDGRRHVAQGRDLISLRFADGDWRLIRRHQLQP